MSEKFVVTYANLNSFPPEVSTVIVEGKKKVKEMAEKFIACIPDDPEGYQEDIDDWNGNKPLLFWHQDDDFFYFEAKSTEVSSDVELEAFDKFAEQYNHDY